VGRNQKQDHLFAALVSEHADMLMAFIRSTVWDASAAEDICQETMVVAWRRFEDYDPARPLARWLRGIARKRILAYLTKRKRNPVYCTEEVLDALEERLVHIDRLPGDAWTDKVEALTFCMDQLPEEMQRCIRMFYQDEKKTDQIASALETTREVIKKRLQRARSRLADCLRRKGVFPAVVPGGAS
jgi:RNA polymerase sigma-70 factor